MKRREAKATIAGRIVIRKKERKTNSIILKHYRAECGNSARSDLWLPQKSNLWGNPV